MTDFTSREIQDFSAWEYLLIDAANQYGLDKQLFTDRIDWATEHLDTLEAMGDRRLAEQGLGFKTHPLYVCAVLAIRKAQAGLPTGHLVGLDAACSGIQVMSVLTGCTEGARATGLVDPDRCADAYTQCTDLMRTELPHLPPIPRKAVKQACMTSAYGSTVIPEQLFGADTEELAAFWKALCTLAPGAVGLLDTLVNAWQKEATRHGWTLPDGHVVHVPVLATHETKIQVAELGDVCLPIAFKQIQSAKRGKSLAANVTHSVDGYVLRSLVRRCSYDENVVKRAVLILAETCLDPSRIEPGEAVLDAEARFRSTRMLDAVVLRHVVDAGSASGLSPDHVQGLLALTEEMLSHKPFDLVTVHDEFKCHANHATQMRRHYREILAEISESTLIDHILAELSNVPTGTLSYPREAGHEALAGLIRQSNYGIC